MLKKYSMRLVRGLIPFRLPSVPHLLRPLRQKKALRVGEPPSSTETSPQKTTGMRTTLSSHARKGQILSQLYRYSFSPVLGFKNSLLLFLKLRKLNIWVMELASAS